MPKELVCPSHQQIELRDYEDPKILGEGMVRIRNEFAAEKHGTMISFYKGHGNQRGAWDAGKQMHVPGGVAWPYPIGLGNMNVGVVEETGPGVTGINVGQRVLYFCNFRPTAVRPASDLWLLPEGTSWKAAVCLDPLSFALCAVRDGDVRIGDSVAIFGLGAIGLMAVQAAKLAGAHPIFAIDPLTNRRRVAQETGADIVIDPVGADVGAQLREATGWRGVDAVIEYSGAMEALQASVRGVAFGGNVVLGAFPGPMKAGLDLGGEAHMNRPNIIFSRTESDPNRDHPRWNNNRVRSECLRLITSDLIDAEEIVTPIVRFDDTLIDEYLKIASSPGENVKLGLQY
jgi:threonine dehydrogenase-like Zn-dependent dehydrogenase